jgi:hypothetical protein
MGACDRCGNEPGSPYTFFYGTSETRTYRTTHSIKGVETVSLGNRCVRRRKRQTWIWLAVSRYVLAAGLILFLGVESGEQTMVYGMRSWSSSWSGSPHTNYGVAPASLATSARSMNEQGSSPTIHASCPGSMTPMSPGPNSIWVPSFIRTPKRPWRKYLM